MVTLLHWIQTDLFHGRCNSFVVIFTFVSFSLLKILCKILHCVFIKNYLIQCKTGGPIFAGACISSVVPSQVHFCSVLTSSSKNFAYKYLFQVLICSRNGSIYSFELVNAIVIIF